MINFIKLNCGFYQVFVLLAPPHYVKDYAKYYQMIIHPYENIKISFLTKHKKEKVIAPKFLKMFDAEIIHTDGYDTDELGTFTRDKARYGDQLDAARRKARIGMEITGLEYGIASEGSFTSDPLLGYFLGIMKL